MVSSNSTYLNKITISLSIVMLAILIALILNIENASSQQQPNSLPKFENETHFQPGAYNETISKPDIIILMDLVRDFQGFGFSGDPYKPQYTSVKVALNENGKLTPYLYRLTDSGINSVEVSDTRIYPSFSFRMPIAPTSTTESIEKISLFFDVNYITKEPEGLLYIGNSNGPITINNTIYRDLNAQFDQYKNDTASLIIWGNRESDSASIN